MEKRRNQDQQVKLQKGFEYSMFVALSDCFPKTECVSPFQESKLCAYYKSLGGKVQKRLKRSCIDFVQNTMMQKLPAEVWQQGMEVTLIGRKNRSWTLIRMECEEYVLEVGVIYHGGKRAEMKYRLVSLKPNKEVSPAA